MQRPPPKVWSQSAHDQAWIEIQRELIKNLRNNRLRPNERQYLADELERLWYPSGAAAKAEKADARAEIRQLNALFYRKMIDRIATTERISKADAKVKVVQKYKLQSVEALETYIRRADKKLTRKSR